ncbi:MAG: hypothetical protein DRP95_02330 [Candidatus Latescibacterota bacterium]|nr:MAG: hypothetical protein DRP95_02330 [Candidatus Latescibacterota bacterium]
MAKRNSPTGEELLLRGLSHEDREAFLALGIVKAFEPQEYIVREGTPGDALYIIRKGKASVWKGDVKLGDLSEGDVFGEAVILYPHNRIACVRAERPTEVLEVKRDDLLTFFKWREERVFKYFILNVISLLLDKLERANERIVYLEHTFREQVVWLLGGERSS